LEGRPAEALDPLVRKPARAGEVGALFDGKSPVSKAGIGLLVLIVKGEGPFLF
jgi:hypothetical protein